VNEHKEKSSEEQKRLLALNRQAVPECRFRLLRQQDAKRARNSLPSRLGWLIDAKFRHRLSFPLLRQRPVARLRQPFLSIFCTASLRNEEMSYAFSEYGTRQFL
jgi:hypothetical protein